MTTTNITNFRKNAFQYVEQTVKYNEPLNICTKDGNAVLLSDCLLYTSPSPRDCS